MVLLPHPHPTSQIPQRCPQGTVPALILTELVPSRMTPGKLPLQWMGICWGQEQDLCLCGRSAAGDSPRDQSASEQYFSGWREELTHISSIHNEK